MAGKLDKTALISGVSDGIGGEIARLLKDYSSSHDDWRPWALFDPASYTRNLVYRDERFELLILCWGAGQVSPIHNHEGQDCWMAVLDGETREPVAVFKGETDLSRYGDAIAQAERAATPGA